MRRSFVIAALGLAVAVFAFGTTTTAKADHRCPRGFGGAGYGGYYGGSVGYGSVGALPVYPSYGYGYSNVYRAPRYGAVPYGGSRFYGAGYGGYGRGFGRYGRGYRGSSFQFFSPGLSFGVRRF